MHLGKPEQLAQVTFRNSCACRPADFAAKHLEAAAMGQRPTVLISQLGFQGGNLVKAYGTIEAYRCICICMYLYMCIYVYVYVYVYAAPACA